MAFVGWDIAPRRNSRVMEEKKGRERSEVRWEGYIRVGLVGELAGVGGLGGGVLDFRRLR